MGRSIKLENHDTGFRLRPYYRPEDCPGHVASLDEPKVCAHCRTNIAEAEEDDGESPFTRTNPFGERE